MLHSLAGFFRRGARGLDEAAPLCHGIKWLAGAVRRWNASDMSLDGMSGKGGKQLGALAGLAVLSVGCGPTGGFTIDDGDDDLGDTGSDPDTNGDGDGGPDPDTGGPNDIPLELVSASTDKTGKFLLLRFSEAMAAPANVDPRDFRVSYAYSITDYYGVYSFYFDPNAYLFYQEFSYLEAVAITAGQMPTDLLITFDVPLSPEACVVLAEAQAELDELNPQPDYEGRVGLFPHYAAGGVAVRSADGESLAAIGPEWVEFPGNVLESYSFGFPNLDPQVPINCIVEP